MAAQTMSIRISLMNAPRHYFFAHLFASYFFVCLHKPNEELL